MKQILENTRTNAADFSNTSSSQGGLAVFPPFSGIQLADESHIIQPKLTIGQPNDRYEREADAVAEQVMQRISLGNTPDVQAKCTSCEEEDRIQRKENGRMPISSISGGLEGGIQAPSGFSEQLNQAKGGGQPLPTDIRMEMEGAFGMDFSGVKVHHDQTASNLNEMIGAKAFTNGYNIYFKEHNKCFNDPYGKSLLAHELVHTIQQKSINYPATIQMQIDDLENYLRQHGEGSTSSTRSGILESVSNLSRGEAESFYNRVMRGSRFRNSRDRTTVRQNDNIVGIFWRKTSAEFRNSIFLKLQQLGVQTHSLNHPTGITPARESDWRTSHPNPRRIQTPHKLLLWNYPIGSSDLERVHRDFLDRFLDQNRGLFIGGATLNVTGRTSITSSESNNQTLSWERAQKVVQEIRRKLPIVRLRYEGKGISDPINPQFTPEGMAMNRSVTIEIITRGPRRDRFPDRDRYWNHALTYLEHKLGVDIPAGVTVDQLWTPTGSAIMKLMPIGTGPLGATHPNRGTDVPDLNNLCSDRPASTCMPNPQFETRKKLGEMLERVAFIQGSQGQLNEDQVERVVDEFIEEGREALVSENRYRTELQVYASFEGGASNIGVGLTAYRSARNIWFLENFCLIKYLEGN